MNRMAMLKHLAPGFLPLIVFIVADSIWGTRIGLVVAVGAGIVELTYSYLKEKTLDRFVLFDIGLIVLLGLVSILLDNDIFFKLKPALIELLFCAVLGLSVYSRFNIIMLMSKRYMKGMTLSPAQVSELGRSLKVLFYLFIGHTGLIVYSAFYLSRAAWAFISGGLFYIIFAGYFLLPPDSFVFPAQLLLRVL